MVSLTRQKPKWKVDGFEFYNRIHVCQATTYSFSLIVKASPIWFFFRCGQVNGPPVLSRNSLHRAVRSRTISYYSNYLLTVTCSNYLHVNVWPDKVFWQKALPYYGSGTNQIIIIRMESASDGPPIFSCQKVFKKKFIQFQSNVYLDSESQYAGR